MMTPFEVDLMPLPLSVSRPESENVTGIRAVPFFLFSFGMPTVRKFIAAVTLSDHPPRTNPDSPVQQSLIQSCQVPFAAVPLNTSRFAGYGGPGAGGLNVTPPDAHTRCPQTRRVADARVCL